MKQKIYLALVMGLFVFGVGQAATTGSPGGVMRVQGITGGVAVPVSGTVTVGSAAVAGTTSDGAAAGALKPVVDGGVDGSGNVQTFLVGTDGHLNISHRVITAAQGDANSNSPSVKAGIGGSQYFDTSYDFVYNGSTWDRQRGGSTGTWIGSNQAAADDTSNSIVFPSNNPAGVPMGTAPFLFDGTTWDRARGDSAGGAWVQGPIADGSASAGKPVIAGGVDASGLAQAVYVQSGGELSITVGAAGADGVSNGVTKVGAIPRSNGGGGLMLQVFPQLYNGSTIDMQRTAGVGNNVAATGLAAAGSYGQYRDDASASNTTSGNYTTIQLDKVGNVRTAPQRPASADILDGYATQTADTSSTALITVTAGRTWVGEACASVSVTNAAADTSAAEVLATFLTAGTSVTPAAGTYFGVNAEAAANAATGTVGTQGHNALCKAFTVAAPAGNTVTLNYALDCNNHSTCRGTFSATGVMQ